MLHCLEACTRYLSQRKISPRHGTNLMIPHQLRSLLRNALHCTTLYCQVGQGVTESEVRPLRACTFQLCLVAEHPVVTVLIAVITAVAITHALLEPVRSRSPP